jgi:predicted PurR-regulated permease PerM/methanogenic corrinoid protein MtbC1
VQVEKEFESAHPSVVDRRRDNRRLSTSRLFVGAVLVVAVLYVAKPVFLPIAIAILLSFVLRPVAATLERRIGRRAGVIVALASAVALISLVAWGLASQMSTLAHEFGAYAGNLEQKLDSVQSRTGGSLELFERTLQRLAQSGEAQERPDMAVRVVPPPRTIGEQYEAFAPAFEAFATTFLVIVLVFFLLLEGQKIRDRILRLAGRANLTVTTQAIGEMTHRITRYIFTQAALNFGYGTLVGLGVWALGVPHAFLWGVLAGLLRFIPYIGAAVSAALPILLTIAVYPGWSRPLAVGALFLVLDHLIGGFIEPLVVGHRVGVSPVAILVSAILWGWLWGPAGLILAVPITVTLVVGGEFIPALRPFSILMGRESLLEGYLAFYNRLLSRDRIGAAAIADHYAEEQSMEAAFSELLMPALSFSYEERTRGRISTAQDHFIKDAIREIVTRLGDRNSTVTRESPRVVAASVGRERISFGTFMLAQMIRAEGWAVDFFTDLPPQEVIDYVREVDPPAVFISCSDPDHLEEAWELLRGISAAVNGKMIVGSGSALTANAAETRQAGATYIPTSLHAAKAEFLRAGAGD